MLFVARSVVIHKTQTLHLFRHSVANDLLRSYKDLPIIRYLLRLRISLKHLQSIFSRSLGNPVLKHQSLSEGLDWCEVYSSMAHCLCIREQFLVGGSLSV